MSLLDNRSETRQAILKGRFIDSVLKKNGREINADIQKRMDAASFRSSFWSNRNFSTSNGVLTYSHLKQHRFIDMKTRQTANGIIRKKHYAIHNKVLFGHANNVIRELSFGFTQSVKGLAFGFPSI